MWLLQVPERRRPEDDFGLGLGTAFVAGLVNVCSVMMFFAFSSNVTGHVATFAEEVVKGRWYQVSVVLGWMAMFLLGAFMANLSATLLSRSNRPLGQGAPVALQIMALAGVAHYGEHHYLETLWETELLVGALLFTMGLQNGTVATVSNSVVRTTHLTGLFTDLGMELSMLLQPRFRDARLRFRLVLHVGILIGYLLGGLIGGVSCSWWGFRALYLACALLGALLLRDLVALWRAARRAEAGLPSTTATRARAAARRVSSPPSGATS